MRTIEMALSEEEMEILLYGIRRCRMFFDHKTNENIDGGYKQQFRTALYKATDIQERIEEMADLYGINEWHLKINDSGCQDIN